MPGGNGNGPSGNGPMTGRAAGYCAGFAVPGYANPAGRRFPGRAGSFIGARGQGGKGNRNWYYATGLAGWQRNYMGMPAWRQAYISPVASDVNADVTMPPDEEKELLKEQVEFLKHQIDDMQLQLEELGKESEKALKKEK